MAVKLTEKRYCDFCSSEAFEHPCHFCHKDFCATHSVTLTIHSNRQTAFAHVYLCETCAKDVIAILQRTGKTGITTPPHP